MKHHPDGNTSVVRIGTRGSALALAQASMVSRALESSGIDHETVIIETAGDRRAPDTAWGEGAFVSAIERALVDGRVDAAVHSAKDVPTEEDPRLRVAAYLAREEPRDALVLAHGATGSVDSLPAGTVIGTDSPRRTGFLRAHRADLEVRPLHGNVDTRLRRLDDGAVGALLLAAAGLIRLGRADRISQLVPVDTVPPAPGQGAIAVQVRSRDELTAALMAHIDDETTRRAVEAERAFLNATGGGCRAPIGALATIDGDTIELLGGFATVDGRAAGLERISGPKEDALALAEALAIRVVARRARLPGAPRVLVTRAEMDARRLVGRLAEYGLAGIVVPAIETELLDQGPELQAALTALADFNWAVVTSANGARAVRLAAARLGVDVSLVRWAAVGHATARELMAAGLDDVWLPTESNAAALGRELPADPGDHVLWACGDLADGGLGGSLLARGLNVTATTVYRTIVAPGSSRRLLVEALALGPIDALVLASPSAARGLLELADDAHRPELLAIPAVCVGPRTAAAALEVGFVVIGEARTQDSSTLAELTAELVSAPRGAPRDGVAT